MIEANNAWTLGLNVFAMIFLTELGDRTQIATLLVAADQPGQRLAVFAGAASALVLATAIGVLAAGWVAHYVPQKALHLGVGVMFIIVGLWTLKAALPA